METLIASVTYESDGNAVCSPENLPTSLAYEIGAHGEAVLTPLSNFKGLVPPLQLETWTEP